MQAITTDTGPAGLARFLVEATRSRQCIVCGASPDGGFRRCAERFRNVARLLVIVPVFRDGDGELGCAAVAFAGRVHSLAGAAVPPARPAKRLRLARGCPGGRGAAASRGGHASAGEGAGARGVAQERALTGRAPAAGRSADADAGAGDGARRRLPRRGVPHGRRCPGGSRCLPTAGSIDRSGSGRPNWPRVICGWPMTVPRSSRESPMRGADQRPAPHRVTWRCDVGNRVGVVGGCRTGRALRFCNRSSIDPSPPGRGTCAEVGRVPICSDAPDTRGIRWAAFARRPLWLTVFSPRRRPHAGEPPSDALIVTNRATRVNESVVATREPARQWTSYPCTGSQASDPRRWALPTVQGVIHAETCAKRTVSQIG